jgi:multidrug efflux system membrane fusion protein
MRILPPLTALAVAASLYAAVFERDRLASFMPAPAAEPAQTAESPPVLTPTEVAAGAISVVALRSVAQPLQNAVLARGRTEAARHVDVRAETSGLVMSEPLRRGAFVTAGQVLCQLAPGTRTAQADEARARLSEARARLTEAEVNADAATRLSEGGFATETRRVSAAASLEAARAGLQAAEAAVATAEAEIDRLTIAAPFEGLLETDTAELGSLLQPGGACATVIQLDPIKIVAFLAEADVDRVAVGAIAGARLVSGRDVAGRVTFLSRSADEATRTFRVELTVPNADLSIRDGQTAEMLIETEAALAHLLPASSLTLNDDGTLGVRVVTEGRTAQFLPVSVLRDSTQGVLVTGLPDKAEVIIVGQEYVTDGTPLAVTFQDAFGQPPAAGTAPAQGTTP